MKKNKFTFIDFFSGVGGFRIPAENFGGKCIGFSEIDQSAISVYEDNFNNDNESPLGDITNLNKLPKADVYFGGVPCKHGQLLERNWALRILEESYGKIPSG